MNAAPGEPHFYARNRLCVARPGQHWCKYDEVRWSDVFFVAAAHPRVATAHPAHVVDPPCSQDQLLKAAGQKFYGHASSYAPNEGRYPAATAAWVASYRHMETDDAHFGCSFLREYPDPIVGWKWPENGDCSAGLALNAAQAILNRIRCGMHGSNGRSALLQTGDGTRRR